TNDDEGTMFALHLDRAMTLDGLRAMAAQRVGDRADEVIAAYQVEYPDFTPHQIAVQWMGDLRFWTCSLDVADAASAAGTPVHVYRFGWKAQGLGGMFGAMHALEIPFVWQTMLGWDVAFGTEPPEALSEHLHRAWINYVRTGDPGHEGIGAWPRYDTAMRPTMRFDEHTRIVDDPGAGTHRVWRS
ncbi:MAG: carboxylesterase family protein, partial [Acidimicrobiales bacterium]